LPERNAIVERTPVRGDRLGKLFVKATDKIGKADDAHMSSAWLIILLLCVVVSQSSALGAQETRDTTLTMGKPEDVGMSGPVLKAAVSLYFRSRGTRRYSRRSFVRGTTWEGGGV